MPRVDLPRAEPEGWRGRRTGWTWGILALTIVIALVTQWLSQIAGGAIVGGTVGLEGLVKIDADDAETLNGLVWWLTGIITFVVAAYTMLKTSEDLSWSEMSAMQGFKWGMRWWESFWRPVLAGAGVHGAIFGGAMYLAAAA